MSDAVREKSFEINVVWNTGVLSFDLCAMEDRK